MGIICPECESTNIEDSNCEGCDGSGTYEDGEECGECDGSGQDAYGAYRCLDCDHQFDHE